MSFVFLKYLVEEDLEPISSYLQEVYFLFKEQDTHSMAMQSVVMVEYYKLLILDQLYCLALSTSQDLYPLIYGQLSLCKDQVISLIG